MKKLLDRPQDTVRDMLLGLAGLNPGLRVLADEDVAIAAVPDRPEDRPVALISGGGSGHEPAHAGYVGAGMLSA
ncbi:dihydroxyacetone kinase subunit DhaK, partial [Endobacter medicaginis]